MKTTNIAIVVYVLLLGGFLIFQDSLPNAFQWLVYALIFFIVKFSKIVKLFGPYACEGSILGIDLVMIVMML